MTRSTNLPVSAFGAELHAVLRKGAQQTFEIKFPTPNLAIRFRHRVNHLRAAMKREKHSDWENLYRCGVHIKDSDKCVLEVGPRDAEFRSFLKDAGVDVDEPVPVTRVTVEAPKPGEEASVDSFLGQIIEQTTVPPKEAENTPPEGKDKA